MAVKNSDMYYAYSNNEGIKEKGEYGGVVTTIMKHLLESNVVDGIVAVKEGFDLYDAVPCLITDPEEVIKTAGSIHCGTVNLASFIYKYLDGCRINEKGQNHRRQCHNDWSKLWWNITSCTNYAND